MRPRKIALIGSRGIPANYGGYETLMEELSTRLAARGHQVTVYCRRQYTPRALRHYKGVDLVVLPTLRTKHLDTPVHTFLSCLHAAQQDFDAAIVVNSANAIFLPLLQFAEVPVALHVDGIERQRAKWGWLGRTVYRISERLAARLPDVLITDAEVVREYYQKHHGIESTMIAYGVEPRPEPPGQTLTELGLEPERYFLYVSRFEPENNPHRVVEAYRRVPGDLPLVMVGGAPYASEFIRQFTADADPRVRFPGSIYGRGYRELQTHALAYVHATEVGGTHPALVEAMGYGNCVLVNDAPENLEVAGEAGLYFSAAEPETLTELMTTIAGNKALSDKHSRQAAQRAAELYSWPSVTASYESLIQHLARD